VRAHHEPVDRDIVRFPSAPGGLSSAQVIRARISYASIPKVKY
jgi:hypothetical protein